MIIIGTVDEIETRSTMETGTTIGIGTMGGITTVNRHVSSGEFSQNNL
jgi:hypothetical protein